MLVEYKHMYYPHKTHLKEEPLKRRRTWGSNVEIAYKKAKINTELLSKRWNIGLQGATQMLQVTTQKGIRNICGLLKRQLSSQSHRIKMIAPGTWYTDTFLSKVPIITGKYKATQIFFNAKCYEELIPIKINKYCNGSLVMFIKEVRISEHLVRDGALVEQGSYGTDKTNWNTTQRKYSMYQTFIQHHCPWKNLADLSIWHLSRDIM